MTMKADAEIQAYYERFAEEARLTSGRGQLEFARTADVLSRILPPPPATVIDVGGAAGVYSAWLAERGYTAHLVDASPRLVAEARKRNAALAAPVTSLDVADARALPHADGFADAVLIMGPLYHLTDRADRLASLREAARVLRRGGLVVAAAVSRYASALDGLARTLTRDPAFVAIRNRDLVDGQHRNETNHPEYFTTAYFHRPGDLEAEIVEAGFGDVRVVGVEGPGWLLADFDERWRDAALRRDLIEVARALESESAIVGASAHLLGVGRVTR